MKNDPTRLTTAELAERWGMKVAGLEGWRERGQGPKYLKLLPTRGGRVIYLLKDVEAYEKKHTINPKGKK